MKKKLTMSYHNARNLCRYNIYATCEQFVILEELYAMFICGSLLNYYFMNLNCVLQKYVNL